MTNTKENTKENATEDENPLKLHNSDSPSLILVSKLLEPNNYGQWSRAMQISLSAKNKIGLIDGSIPKPSSTNKTLHAWQRCNDMVLSWILNSVSPDLASSIIYMDTAAAAWKDLKDRLSQGNETRIYQIQQEIVEHRQGTDSISIYYNRKKALWDELASYQESFACTCEGMKKFNERMEREKLMQFLMGLNETYTTVRNNILMMKPLPNTQQAFSMALQHERQLDVASRREGPATTFRRWS
ncbi:unnamed protein product [Trifolium pratense]|uniref:Uncharacterized protein n=1 Tax=Trifolium pratense TaxID=57577 RepID=A0ACB0KD74_TRIPR|nr:unnamed protein product [Trifolium pratense]